jgi:hypothetical protein
MIVFLKKLLLPRPESVSVPRVLQRVPERPGEAEKEPSVPGVDFMNLRLGIKVLGPIHIHPRNMAKISSKITEK